MNHTEEFKHLADLIKEINIAMLTTTNEDGTMHTRPMATQKIDTQNFDGTLWFFSKRHSHKNQSIENDQHVNLAYAKPDRHHYISIMGRAFVSDDREKMNALWNPELSIWFPEGLMDPEITLIGINIESAEIWDSPISKASQMMNFVKSAITGKTYDNRHGSHHVDVRTQH